MKSEKRGLVAAGFSLRRPGLEDLGALGIIRWGGRPRPPVQGALAWPGKLELEKNMRIIFMGYHNIGCVWVASQEDR